MRIGHDGQAVCIKRKLEFTDHGGAAVMGRPTDWHVLDLDQDPTPGDPTRVDALARRLKDFADDVGDALRSVKGLSGDSAVQGWTGLTAEEYRSHFDGLPGELAKLERSYRMCGDALAGFWPKLQQAQGDADRALEQGRRARADLAVAQRSLDSADDWVKRANDRAKKYQEDPRPGAEPPSDAQVKAASRNAADAAGARRDASSAVGSAQGRLDAAKQLAADARSLRDDEARKAKGAVEDASDAGIRNKKWYEKAVDWVVDHWDDIVAVCKVIVAVVGVIVMIVGGPLAWLVLAAALVVLADTLAKYAQGKASLWDVAFAALDCIPGFKGLTTAGGLLKLAKGGLTGMKGQLGNIAQGLRGGMNRLRQTSTQMFRRSTAGDPVDVVTGETVLPQTDLELPGVLPLTVSRAHVSSYRDGRWFGRSWASTLDQRLEIDDEGVVFYADDGVILYYPVPVPGAPVMPLAGPRWPLAWSGAPGGEMLIGKPETGHVLHFDPGGPALPGGRPNAVELPLRALTDRNDHRIRFDYDDGGLPTGIRHSGGYRIGVETAGGRVTALRLLSDDRQPLLRRYGYDTDGRLVETGGPEDRPLRFAYDNRGRITGWKDRNGTEYGYTYDEDGRCVRTEGSGGFLSGTFAYDDGGRTTVHTDSLGHATTYHYDEALQVVREVDPLGAVTVTERDRDGRVTARVDPLGRTTRYAHEEGGRRFVTTHADGAAAAVGLDELGLAVSATDPSGASARQEYDERGNLVSATDATGATLTCAYDDRGHLTTVTDASGRTRRAETDPAGLTVAVTDALGGRTLYERDAFGRIVAITDEAGATTRIGWTAQGRPAWRVRPDGAREEWTYDGEGDLVAYRDPAGGTTRFEMTHFDLPAVRVGPDGARLEFTYDSELRLTAVTNDDGAVWSYEYDCVGNVVRETDFRGRTLGYEYDLARQLVARTNGMGQTVRYRRDTAGNVVEMRCGDEVTTFAYGPNGRMLAAANAHAELEFGYDAGGRLTAETCNGRTVSSVYDELGHRIARTTPSGATSAWEYDALGRPGAVRTPAGALGFTRDAVGREVVRRIGAAASLTQSWDACGRLTAQRLSAGAEHGTALERGWTHRADGRPAAVTDRATGSRTFELDPVGRITGVEAAGWTERYVYGPDGSLREGTGVTVPPVGGRSADGPSAEALLADGSVTGALPADGPMSDGPLAGGSVGAGSGEEHGAGGPGRRRAGPGRTRRTYDAQGRVVGKTRRLLSGGVLTWTYEWDAEDRLVRLTDPRGAVWRYLYDPLGRRIAKLRMDGARVAEETVYVWDRLVLAEQTCSSSDCGDSTTTWDWMPGDVFRPVAQRHSVRLRDAPQEEIDARFHAIVTDAVGTPTELVCAEGRVEWRWRSTVWGAGPAQAGPDGTHCPLRFPGQYHDEESGLHYNYHRYYDPETARYLTADPLGLEPGPDDQGYVSNPLVLADPLGLAPCAQFQDVFRGPSQGLPGGQRGPAVSIRQVRMDLGRAGMSVSDYDIVHVPEIRTPTGLAFGNSPHTMGGVPETGPRGLPLIQISDIGLRSTDEAVTTIFHEIYHHQQFQLTMSSGNVWGGSEEAAEEFGRRMLDQFHRRSG